MRNILCLLLLGLSLVGLSLIAPGSVGAADFGQKEKATVNHPDSGTAPLGGSQGDAKAIPQDSTRGTPPPDERTGNYLPGSAGVQRYNQQVPNKGVVPPLGGTNEAPGTPGASGSPGGPVGGSAGDQGQSLKQPQDQNPQGRQQ